MAKPFSVAFKQKMVQRLTGRHAVSASQLAREMGVRQQNLSRWLQEARSLPIMVHTPKPAARREWTVEQKARVLTEASHLDGEELTAYLEREGAKLAEYEQWRIALDEGGGAAASTNKRIRQLERELARKEKALARRCSFSRKSGVTLRGGRGRRHQRGERAVILELLSEAQASCARLAPACRVLGISARSIERWRADPEAGDRRCGPRRRPSNALSPAEEAQVVTVLTSSRYAGLSPKQLVPQLADEGLYLASESTMYRVQRRHGLRSKQRTTPRTHVTRASTVHQATGPNQAWSWDITWLPTTVRGWYLYLYLIMDVWSRRIVGWRIAERESADVAAALITQSCSEGNVDPRGLVLHSDNGTPMRGGTMISTLQWLGVIPSFSRPHVSDDNPYSEALFRTLKHTPAYPRLPFADLAPATRWVARFVEWYNGTHRHSAIR